MNPDLPDIVRAISTRVEEADFYLCFYYSLCFKNTPQHHRYISFDALDALYFLMTTSFKFVSQTFC